MKKLSFILCIALIVSLFVGCGGDSNDGTASGGSADKGDIFSTEAVNYVANGESVYRIIRPENGTDAETAAASLLFKQYRDLHATIKNTADTEDGTDVYEILLGNTNRPETEKAKNWLLDNNGGRYDDYIICTSAKRSLFTVTRTMLLKRQLTTLSKTSLQRLKAQVSSMFTVPQATLPTSPSTERPSASSRSSVRISTRPTLPMPSLKR